MSSGREILLCCVVLMLVAMTTSQDMDRADIGKHMSNFDLPCWNLRMAERRYVQCMFGDRLPQEFSTNTSQPFWGISLPAQNNSGQVLTFMSTISDCFNSSVWEIVTNLTHSDCHSPILKNISRFLREFRLVLTAFQRRAPHVAPARCPEQITACDDYCKKENVLRIFIYTRTWVQSFKVPAASAKSLKPN